MNKPNFISGIFSSENIINTIGNSQNILNNGLEYIKNLQ